MVSSILSRGHKAAQPCVTQGTMFIGSGETNGQRGVANLMGLSLLLGGLGDRVETSKRWRWMWGCLHGNEGRVCKTLKMIEFLAVLHICRTG